MASESRFILVSGLNIPTLKFHSISPTNHFFQLISKINWVPADGIDFLFCFFYELLGFLLLCIPVKQNRTCVLDPDQDLEIILSNENKIEEMKTHLLHIPKSTSLKGSVHSHKMKIHLLFIHPYGVPIPYANGTQKEMFLKNVLRALFPYNKSFLWSDNPRNRSNTFHIVYMTHLIYF